MARYASPWDGKLKVSTALFLVVAIGLGGWIAAQGLGPGGPLPAPVLVVPVLLGAVAVLAWALAPRGYSLEAGRLRVERRLFSLEVPLRDIRAVEALPDGALGASVRLWGSGGIFGYHGRFWSRRLGHYRLYATRSSGLVRIVTAGGAWVLSPEPAARFVEEVLARAPAVRAPGPADAAGGAGGGAPTLPGRLRLLPAGIAAVVGLGLAAVMAASWAWAPRSVAVAGGEVVIERRWAGPERIPVSTVTEVRPLGREDFRGWRRVSGVALFGQASYGRYRSDALGPFQLYAWRRGPHVLLATSAGKVVVTPDDWKAFVGEVRAGLGRSPAP